MALTPALMRDAATAAGGYVTPGLNEVLCLSRRGVTAVGAALAAYTGLRALHLDGNGIDSVADMPPLPALKCLFLEHNALTSLAGLAAACPALATLDVSGNRLATLAGAPPSVDTLRAAGNPVTSLHNLPATLVTLDVAHCGLGDAGELAAALARAPRLRALYAAGNPAAAALGRLRLLAACPGLTYLDDGPVTGGDRAAAAALAKGGGAAAADAARAEWACRENARVRAVEEGGVDGRGGKENDGAAAAV